MSIQRSELFYTLLNNEIAIDKDIGECRCFPLLRREYRELYFEEPLLERIEKIFTENKNLTIVSIASGGCLQELSICFRLAKKGFSVDRFIIIDPWYFDKEYHEVVPVPSKFKKYFTELFPNGLVTAFRKEKDYKNALENHRISFPDIFLSVDMDKWKLYERIERCQTLFENSDKPCLFGYYDKNLEGNMEERMDKEAILHIQQFEPQGEKGPILSHKILSIQE